MNLRRYEPWSGLTGALVPDDLGRFMRTRINRLFPDLEEEEGILMKWSPAVDIQEKDDAYMVRADLPGVDPGDIDITLEHGVMTIRGKRVETHQDEQDGFSRKERFSGEFFRRFSLPDSAESDKVTATSKKGVVEILIPKAHEKKARHISVKALDE